tara:strand:- start:147 stop:278 length:132 start_codon:yes stop_codon:yes gene_type:complete
MKTRDLKHHILRPMLRAVAWGCGAVACALVIPIVFALGIALAG